jgi:spermidine synthase
MAPYLRPGIRRALCIGGGAVIYPRDLLRASPQTKVDVVELDPGVTRIAREFFALTDDPRLTMVHEDGRVFLNREGPAYDAVFLDVFWARTIPFHLATLESARRIAARLTESGVLLVNFVSAIEGPQGEFFRAEYATLRRVSPQVLVFAVLYPAEPARVQNLILVAFRSAVPPSLTGDEMGRYASHLWRYPIPGDMPVLTDDFAPVEQYAARQLEPDRR